MSEKQKIRLEKRRVYILAFIKYIENTDRRHIFLRDFIENTRLDEPVYCNMILSKILKGLSVSRSKKYLKSMSLLNRLTEALEIDFFSKKLINHKEKSNKSPKRGKSLKWKSFKEMESEMWNLGKIQKIDERFRELWNL